MKPKSHYHELVEQALFSSQWFHHEAASQQLSSYYPPDEILEAFHSALFSEDVQISSRALEVIGHLESPLAIASLGQRLEQGGELAPRSAQFLARIESPEVIPWLRQAMASMSYNDMLGAAQALGRWCGAEVLPLLLEQAAHLSRNSWDGSLWWELIEKLTRKAQPEHLLDSLRSEKAEVRTFAAEALGRLQAPEALKPLVELLQDEEHQVRIQVVKALGRIGQKEAGEFLLPLLRDPYPQVCIHAAEALGALAYHPAAETLSRLALHHKNSSLRLESVKALGQMDVANSFAVFREVLLRDKKAGVRRQAADSMGTLRDRRSVKPLQQALQDRHYKVRCAAAKSLGKLQSRKARKALEKATQDEHPSVREAASRALRLCS